jgi:hypothetical protein
VFYGEVDQVSRLVGALAQVEYIELLALVDYEEFAEATHKAAVVGVDSDAATFGVEVEQTPLYLNDRVLARLVPNCHWS